MFSGRAIVVALCFAIKGRPSISQAARNCRWLMIFDNVDRDVRSSKEDAQAFEVKSFLLSADHGSVLITTRLPSLRRIGQSTAVGSLKQDHAQELLSYHSGLRPSSHGRISVPSKPGNTSLTTYLTDMTKLIQRPGYLPLALVQAGTYMHKTKTGCSKKQKCLRNDALSTKTS